MQRGYVKLHRKTIDSGLMQSHKTFTLFSYLLMMATHKDMGYDGIDLKRGQYVSGRNDLAIKLKLTQQEVRTALKKLEKMEIITIKSTNKYSVYTIVNYDIYQSSEDIDNQQNNKQATNKQPASNQQATTKQEHKHISTKEHKSNRGSRLPTTWTCSQEYIDYCKKERPDLNPDVIAMDFKDYWISVAGSKGVKLDWFATWRSWVRRQKVEKSMRKNKSEVVSDKQFDEWLGSDETYALNKDGKDIINA